MSILRAFAEQEYQQELAELVKQDTGKRPENWRLSPQAVVTYLMGGVLSNGFEVTPKYIGSRRLMEIAVATLVTDRALLLFGLPGTAKSWVSEHIAAAVSGDSTLLVQGTAGTSEDAIRYGWNYALLLAAGPSMAAVVPSPMMNGMNYHMLSGLVNMNGIPACLIVLWMMMMIGLMYLVITKLLLMELLFCMPSYTSVITHCPFIVYMKPWNPDS